MDLTENIKTSENIENTENLKEDIIQDINALLYPVLPLRGIVVFPFAEVTLDVGREISMRAVETAVGNGGKILLLTQKDGLLEEPTEEDFYEYGLLAEVKKVVYLPANGMRITVKGLEKVRIKEYKEMEPYIQCEYEPLNLIDEDLLDDNNLNETEAFIRTLERYFEDYARNSGKISREQARKVSFANDIEVKIALMCNQIIAPSNERYQLFAMETIKEKMEFLLAFFIKAEKLNELENKINQEVKENIDQSQKEFYLREKIKVISEELGDGEDKAVEIQEINERLANMKLPIDVKEKIQKEIKKLNRIMPMSPEYGVIRNYIDWVLDLPWGVYTTDEDDIHHAQEILERDHYGLEKVKERIIEFLAVRQLKDDSKGPIICLVGPPGVGKTSLAKSIAEALNKNYVRLSLGGVHDESEIRGHRRTYIGAMPGRIIRGMVDAKSSNPLFLFDEIDKMTSDYHGDPSSALLEVLDPEQNSTFSDNFIELPFDLSKVMFLTTANSVQGIPAPLLDRMEIIELSGYTEEEKLQIAIKYLLPKQMVENGLTVKQITVTEEAIRKIIQNYTREAGVRTLERQIGNVCRKVVTSIVKGERKSAKVTEKNVQKYLGIPRYSHTDSIDKDEIGVVNGMAWTAVGGELLPIEAVIMPGKGNLQLTGKLGDVMKESAQMGLSYIRSVSNQFSIEENFYEKYDIHIHAPEGAVPKDGPSAGVTMVTAMISALTKRKVRSDIAMTGEMTLRGKVLPIGGVKEKVLAAYREGIREVILPIDNKKDMEEIPENIRKEITFRFAETMTQVLTWALRD